LGAFSATPKTGLCGAPLFAPAPAAPWLNPSNPLRTSTHPYRVSGFIMSADYADCAKWRHRLRAARFGNAAYFRVCPPHKIRASTICVISVISGLFVLPADYADCAKWRHRLRAAWFGNAAYFRVCPRSSQNTRIHNLRNQRPLCAVHRLRRLCQMTTQITRCALSHLTSMSCGAALSGNQGSGGPPLARGAALGIEANPQSGFASEVSLQPKRHAADTSRGRYGGWPP
jgi:hypothetical protein